MPECVDASLLSLCSGHYMLNEEEIKEMADMHGFACRSVCACQCGIKRHGVAFKCFSTKEFVLMWTICEVRGGVTLSSQSPDG